MAKKHRKPKEVRSATSMERPRLRSRLLVALSCIVIGAAMCLPWLWPSLGWTIWLSVAGMAAITSRGTPRQIFWRMWLVGYAMHTAGAHWLPDVLERFARHPPALAWTLILALHAVGALRYALAGWIVAWLRGGRPGILLLPVVWTALEFLWPSLFPYRLGQALLQFPVLVQLTEWTGAFGPTFLVVWGGTLLHVVLAGVWMARPISGATQQSRAGGEPAFTPVSLRWHLTGFAAAITLTVVYGLVRIRTIEQAMAASPVLRVALIQPGTMGRERLRACMQLSKNLPEDVQLIVWPESAIGALSMEFDDFRSAQQLEEEGRDPESPLIGPRAYYLVGGDSFLLEPERHFNSALLISPEEKILARYHKRTLIPFGEYIPGERWFPSMRRFSPWEIAFEAGDSAEPLVMEGGARLGICICYEDLLPGLNRASVSAGAELLVNLTNDAWFGDSMALPQHQHLALMRTIENRRYLLRATTTGSTAIVSPIGVVVSQAPMREPAVILGDVHPLNIATFYTRFGDVFAWLCVAAVAFIAARSRLRARQKKLTA